MAGDNVATEYSKYPDEQLYGESYANNVFFEPSAWDMKLVFGQLDQRDGKNLIRQHTAVTMSWAQIKLLSFWLRGYIEFQESLNGKIVIPPSGFPRDVPGPTEEQRAADPNVDKVYEIFRKTRDLLIEEQKK